MSHAVYTRRIEHIIIDNLQFMMGTAVDQLWRQDVAVESLRRFSTQHNCHITLIAHPRKVMSGSVKDYLSKTIYIATIQF